MNISNQTMAGPLITSEPTLDLKQGEVHKGTGKEKVQSSETNQGSTDIKPTDLSQVLKRLGAGQEPSPELREAVRMILGRGTPLTKEGLQELKAFLEMEKGTLSQKLDTIQALLNRRLDVTLTHLRAIHQVLHGQALPQLIDDVSQQLIAKLLQRNDTRGSQPGLIDTEILEQLTKLEGRANEGGRTEASTVSREATAMFKQAIQRVQREPQFGRVIEQVRQQIANNPAFPQEAAVQVDKAIQEAASLLQQGRELAARQHLIQALNQAETGQSEQAAKAQAGAITAEGGQQNYLQNEQFQTSQHLSTKDVIVTKISQRLALASQEFSVLKRDVSRGLDQAARLIQQLQQSAIPQAKNMLSASIDKLDKAILKSELTMLTDMKTEKQLMQASGQLAEAKRLLQKGDHHKAHQMVQEVKTMLDTLRWQPSETKIQHLALKESQHLEQTRPAQQLLNQLEETTRPLLKQEPSARQMFELLRGLGLNHDSEAAQSLTQQREGNQPLGSERNIKALLMQLIRTEAEQGRLVQQAEQTLQNLTGQQLLGRSDPGSNMQNLLFHIPVLLEDKLENLQVLINSRNDGEKLDWENCSIYFLIETKKLGEVGILLSATDRNLSVTIKNNMQGLKEKIEPLMEECIANLKEIGYHVAAIHFTKLDSKQEQQAKQAPHTPSQSAGEAGKIPELNRVTKGFDLKI